MAVPDIDLSFIANAVQPAALALTQSVQGLSLEIERATDGIHLEMARPGARQSPDGPAKEGGATGGESEEQGAQPRTWLQALGAGVTAVASATKAAVVNVTAFAQGLQAQFQTVTSAVTPFVQAFNPAALIPFRMAMDGVTATIGKALTPVIEVATGIVQDFAQKLAPIMAELRPVIEQVSQSLAGVLGPVIDALAVTAKALMPVIQLLAGVFQGLATVAQAVVVTFTAVLKSVMDALGGLFGNSNPLQSFTEMFVSVMQRLAQAVILATAHISKLFGVTSVTDNLIKGLTGGVAAKGAPEVKNQSDARFTGFADFGRSIAQRAFEASAATPEQKSPEESWRTEVLAELRNIQKDKTTITDHLSALGDVIADAISDGFETIRARVFGSAPPTFAAGVNNVAGAVGGSAFWAKEKLLNFFNGSEDQKLEP